MPMIAGSRPRRRVGLDRARAASGRVPSAFFADIMITAAAPSLMPEALPAVTVPSLSKRGAQAGQRFDGRAVATNSSVSNAPDRPSSAESSTGMISSLNLPAFCAASALFCDCARIRPAAAREISYFFATFSAVMPMWYWLYTSHRPSTIMRVDQLGVAHAEAVARTVQHVRRGAHVLLAAGDDDLGVAATDALAPRA